MICTKSYYSTSINAYEPRDRPQAHKGGYQVAVLAVKESCNGKQFSFNYEGVAGKPCMLLEQLFKELVTGCGGICSQSNQSNHTVAENASETDPSRKFNHALNKSECLKDGEKLELLLDIASLISTNRTQQQRPVSKMKKKRAKRNHPINACVEEEMPRPLSFDTDMLITNSELHHDLSARVRSADTSNTLSADSFISEATTSSNFHEEAAGRLIDAPDPTLMAGSSLNKDRAKVQGAPSYAESLSHGATAIFPPDGYYSPMEKKTTSESRIDPVIINEFQVDIIKTEPDNKVYESHDSIPQSASAKYGHMSAAVMPSNQPNHSQLPRTSSLTRTINSTNSTYKQCNTGSSSTIMRVGVAGTRNKKGLFTCKYCSYNCHYSSMVKRHVDAVHLKLKPYQCPSCPYSTTRRGGEKVTPSRGLDNTADLDGMLSDTQEGKAHQ